MQEYDFQALDYDSCIDLLETSNTSCCVEAVEDYLVRTVREDDGFGRFSSLRVRAGIREEDWSGLRSYLVE